MGPQCTGAFGYVESVAGPNLIVSVATAQTAEPKFGAKIAAQTAEAYHPLFAVAKRLNISTRNLSKVTGSVYFEPGRFNLGLNIKFSGKNLQVPGYTRKLGDGPWEFTDRAIQLIAEYKSKFPRVFDLLDQGEDPYNTSDLLPQPNKPPTRSPPGIRTSANGMPLPKVNADGTVQPASDPAKPEKDQSPANTGAEEAPTAHRILNYPG